MVLSPALEEFAKAYAESVHDQWSYAKVNRNKYTFLYLILGFRLNKVGYMVNRLMINIVNILI